MAEEVELMVHLDPLAFAQEPLVDLVAVEKQEAQETHLQQVLLKVIQEVPLVVHQVTLHTQVEEVLVQLVEMQIMIMQDQVEQVQIKVQLLEQVWVFVEFLLAVVVEEIIQDQVDVVDQVVEAKVVNVRLQQEHQV
jgi:hypothetical protein